MNLPDLCQPETQLVQGILVILDIVVRKYRVLEETQTLFMIQT